VEDLIFNEERRRAFVFKNRGALLALPALALAAFGRPSAFSVALGLPLAFAGEMIRCWAVGYSGVTTRGDHVEAAKLTTAGPYAYVRNPLYIGNAVTALGFALAYTGRMPTVQRFSIISGSLGVMAAVYATIIPHEEDYLRKQFGETFQKYCEAVPPLLPLSVPFEHAQGEYDPAVIGQAESRTFLTFGAMLLVLALKAGRAEK
jgi:protein-S-isoprenylcysteine O-methyltransferase Ste14